MKEVFVVVKNIGFCFGVDSKKRHNCVHSAYLSFFNIVSTPCLKKASNEITSADGIIHLENIEPIKFSDVFQYCGKQLALCYDNKLRMCRVYRITFECEGRVITMPFVLDKSLTTPGVLGGVALESLKIQSFAGI